MRISTAQIYSGGLGALQSRQTELLETQQQLASGKRLLTPSDDPAGAVQALELRERIASVEQYARNAGQATQRLEQEETVLDAIGDSLQRVRELTVQAANGSQTAESRAAIAGELRQISAGLRDAANTRDANGEYLFAGFRSRAQPFVTAPDGSVEYVGDAGQRHVDLSPDRRVAVGDSGLSFMSVPRGNGVFTATPDAGNAGTARVTAADVLDPTAYADESYTLTLVASDSYELVDAGGTVVATGTYAPGDAIDFGGLRVVLTGTPAPGDTFAIEPAGETSLFAIVDDLAAALEAPAGAPGELALLNHRTGAALEDLDQALGRVLELRTDVGARLNTIDTQGLADEDQVLSLKESLSGVEDLDYAQAISRFSLQQVALEAAQQTYAQLARLSLFNFLR